MSKAIGQTGAALLLSTALVATSLAQVPPPPVTGPVPAPGAVETAPLAPLPGTPAPGAPAAEAKPADAAPAPNPSQAPNTSPAPNTSAPNASPAPSATPAAPATPSAPPAASAPPAPPAAQPAPAQAPPAPQPGPAAPAQAQPPAPPATPANPPAVTVPSVPSAPGLPTLAPGMTEQNSSDEVELVAKKAAALKGSATWDNGYTKISEALMKIRAEMLRANIKAVGKPIAIFLSSDDESFQFEAMIPIDPAADIKTPLGSGVTISQTPSGKSFRFGHKGAYDSIDDTYEVLTAYLDAKGVEARESFIEEYITDDLAPLDENFTLHIYVQPK